MPGHDDESHRSIAEQIRYLNETAGWPWQVPCVESVGLDDQGRIMRYLATEDGLVPLGPAEP